MDLMIVPPGGAEAIIVRTLEVCQHWQESRQAVELSLHSVLRTEGGESLGHSSSCWGAKCSTEILQSTAEREILPKWPLNLRVRMYEKEYFPFKGCLQ